jgi:hypothetical protein
MTLSEILALWEAGKLPEGSEQLCACKKVMQAAFAITMDVWASTSNPVTGAMLNNELVTYEKVIRAISQRLVEQPLKSRQLPGTVVRCRRKSMFYMASRVI